MNQNLLALLLGIVEGITEFLPVSSTAHLRISEALLGVPLNDGFWKMFSIVIQLGAILCLPLYFRERIAKFLGIAPAKPGEGLVRILVRFNPWNVLIHALRSRPLQYVLIAFVCTAVPAFLLTKVIGKHLESLYVMAWSLIVGGVVMWVIDTLYARGRLAIRPIDHMEEMSAGQAVWIGLCQIFSAVFPGTSRSMSTIAAGQLGGMTRTAALEFSFFLSIPTMAAATLYDLYKSIRPHHGEPSALGAVHMTPELWLTLGIGFVTSFVVAYVVVAWFMNWVRRRGFTPFAVYRIAIGAAVLAWAMKG